MLKLLIKPVAEKDLEKIFEYTYLTWGFEQAEEYQDDLFHGMQLLLEQNELGKIYPYSNIPYRKLHVNRHLIFYRIEKQSCTIIRIFHERMNIEKHVE
jgi:toxin ParE1/3/4